MYLVFKLWIGFIALMLLDIPVYANDYYYRAYWFPMHSGERLAYCSKNGAICGHDIADQYCQEMGYQGVEHFRIQHNIGKTHYWHKEGECTGWRCHGFKVIACQGQFSRNPRHADDDLMQVFPNPRIENQRVDWCFNQGKFCGRRAAYSFCRRMGYRQAKSYQQEQPVVATRTLGDQILCYGNQCRGFAKITCER
jgi:hypothetical protein